MSSNTFITTDLALAAYLCAIGRTLLRTERQGRFTAFHFDPHAVSDVEQFLNGAPAPAQGVLKSYRELRAIITNQERAEKVCHKTINEKHFHSPIQF